MVVVDPDIIRQNPPPQTHVCRGDLLFLETVNLLKENLSLSLRYKGVKTLITLHCIHSENALVQSNFVHLAAIGTTAKTVHRKLVSVSMGCQLVPLLG